MGLPFVFVCWPNSSDDFGVEMGAAWGTVIETLGEWGAFFVDESTGSASAGATPFTLGFSIWLPLIPKTSR